MNKEENKKDSNFGPTIGSVIIIILIILGGLYFLGYTINKENMETPAMESNERNDSEIDQISNELDSENIDEVDNDIKKIEAELDLSVE